MPSGRFLNSDGRFGWRYSSALTDSWLENASLARPASRSLRLTPPFAIRARPSLPAAGSSPNAMSVLMNKLVVYDGSRNLKDRNAARISDRHGNDVRRYCWRGNHIGRAEAPSQFLSRQVKTDRTQPPIHDQEVVLDNP